MKKKKSDTAVIRPVKTVIFGTSVFSRGVWVRELCEANASGEANENAVLVCDSQNISNRDTVFDIALRGTNGEEIIKTDCVSAVIDPYSDFDSFSSLADIKSLKTLIFSPAEKSWILPDGRLKNDKFCPLAMMTMLLFRRFCLEMRGFEIICACDGAEQTKNDVIAYANMRGLGMDFLNWLNFENTFVSAFVQCMPQGEREDGGHLTVCIEKYLLCVFDRKTRFSSAHITVAESIEPYIRLKKYLFDASLAVSCAYAILHEVDTVSGFMARERLKKHMTVSVFEEIIPTLHTDFETVQIYAMEMMKRFENSAITLKWADIAKKLPEMFAASVVPTLEEYIRINETHPKHLVFALFCTIRLLRMTGDKRADKLPTAIVLADRVLWGSDLTYLLDDINAYEERLG